MKIKAEEYWSLQEQMLGYCPTCDDLTRECTEPDALDYDCPACDGDRVVGLGEALIMDLIEIVGEYR